MIKGRYSLHIYQVLVGCLLSLVLVSGLQAAVPNPSSSFKPESFQSLIDQKTASIIVFSASYCAHCPAVVRSLTKQSRRMAKPPRLIVVMADELPSPADKKSIYNDVDHLMVFEGNEMAIRHAVNPTWRGLTPFVVLVGKDGRVSFFNGQPPGSDLQAWLSQQAR